MSHMNYTFHEFVLRWIVPVVLHSQSFGKYDIISLQLSVSFIQDGQVELEIFPQLQVAFTDKLS